jgi:hypothetical protein
LTECQFRRIVVEHQQVAHARRRRTGQAGVPHQHAQAAPMIPAPIMIASATRPSLTGECHRRTVILFDDQAGFGADVGAAANGRHDAHADRTIFVPRRLYRAHRRLDAVHAGADLAQMRQRCHQANGAVAAYPEVTAVVEKNHPRTGARFHGLTVQRADQHVAATGFQHAGCAPLIMMVGQLLSTLGHAAAAQIGKTGGHQTGGSAAGMGVDHSDAFHGMATSVQMSERKSGHWRCLPA